MERVVRDADGTEWTCVQALAGLGDEAAERLTDEAGVVPVVCTPSGGAQSVRLEVPTGWDETTSDDDLLAAIAEARGEGGAAPR